MHCRDRFFCMRIIGAVVMTAKTLQNNLKTHRKGAGLSQDHMAYLIGSANGATVSRHETGERLPSLSDGFLYSLVAGVPAHDLFFAEYQRVEALLKQRVIELMALLAHDPGARDVSNLLAVLLTRLD